MDDKYLTIQSQFNPGKIVQLSVNPDLGIRTSRYRSYAFTIPQMAGLIMNCMNLSDSDNSHCR